MKTSELIGALLDYWVARAEGAQPVNDYGRPCLQWPGACALMDATKNPCYITTPDYSTDWNRAGPLIEKHFSMHDEFQLSRHRDGSWAVMPCRDDGEPYFYVDGDTPLQAICRAVVRAAFGDEVGEAPEC